MNIIKTVYDFMQYCRMPLSFQGSVRKMKTGDTFILGKYAQRISCEENDEIMAVRDDNEPCYVAEAWIEKKPDFYSFFGTFTFPTKPDRALIITSGKFEILKGGVIRFADDTYAVKLFALVCRYIIWFFKKMPREEKQKYFSANTVPLFTGIWLDSELTERKTRTVQSEGETKTVRINYKRYAPTQQLAAIADVAAAFGIAENKQDE